MKTLFGRGSIIGCAIVCVALGVRAELTPDQQALEPANIEFAYNLLREVAKEQPGKNVFISPYSASTILQLACSGAAGTTKKEMEQVLGTSDLSSSLIYEFNHDLDDSTQGGNNNMVINSGNAIWYQNGLTLKPEFLESNRDIYKATVKGLDFNDPASVGVVNSWVNEKTHGKIPGILSGPIEPDTSIFLANAVYFKGAWMHPFAKEATKPESFHLGRWRSKQVPMMSKTSEFLYLQEADFQAVVLPYRDPSFEMDIFLPGAASNPGKTLGELIQKERQGWAFESCRGTLMLPTFKLNDELDLKLPLKNLGILRAFATNDADFSAMCSERVFISQATQKTFVEVNEEGTEAAATSFIVCSSRGDRPKPFEMTVDRPFVFIIRGKGIILFMGIVYDPAVAN